MKIGRMFRWYWQNTYWGLVGFYGAILILMLLGFSIMIASGTEEISVNGLSFSSEVMLLVLGIIFFPSGTRFVCRTAFPERPFFAAWLFSCWLFQSE